MRDDLDSSWARVGPRVSLLTASAQLGAARAGAAYVPATLDELRQSVDAEAAPALESLAVRAQSLDGTVYGSLDDLLYGAVVRARSADVESLRERLAVGGQWLDMLVRTQVSDAAKQAAGLAMYSRPGVGYVRYVNPPCCQRCAVLAGSSSAPTAFPRHPACDCLAVPTTRPAAKGLTPTVTPDQVKDLTKGQRFTLDHGADLGQVVNAKRYRVAGNGAFRSTVAPDGMTTSAGSLYARAVPRGARLTPEGIFRVYADRPRAEVLDALRANGYLRPS